MHLFNSMHQTPSNCLWYKIAINLKLMAWNKNWLRCDIENLYVLITPNWFLEFVPRRLRSSGVEMEFSLIKIRWYSEMKYILLVIKLESNFRHPYFISFNIWSVWSNTHVPTLDLVLPSISGRPKKRWPWASLSHSLWSLRMTETPLYGVQVQLAG